VQSQAAQVVAHLVGGVVGVEESGDKPAKAPVGEAGDGVDDTAQGAGQGGGAYTKLRGRLLGPLLKRRPPTARLR
jgi:hypothetical protein